MEKRFLISGNVRPKPAMAPRVSGHVSPVGFWSIEIGYAVTGHECGKCTGIRHIVRIMQDTRGLAQKPDPRALAILSKDLYIIT